MKNKQFKTETKKLLDLMINSIYTNKDIFLRELISNASDAIDKLYYRSLTDKNIKVKHKDLEIFISLDKEKRTITIEDNGQCGVGFYSAFMVSDEVRVESKALDSNESYLWISNGMDGYTIESSNKKENGTIITLKLKEDTEDDNYSHYLEEYEIKHLVKKYSDYITYPIKMVCTHNHLNDKKENVEHKEVETLNSLVPIWKKNKNKIKEEEYNNFYMEKFSDYTKPDDIIHINAEGVVTYDGILFIPGSTPYTYYTKEFEKGLQLYSNGVLIMDKCSDLLPDYFSFVKGVIDSPDLKLNISRETLQQSKVLKLIAKNVENKIKKELENLKDNDRSKYEKIYNNFGVQLKYGIYNNFGMDKEKLQDLLLFYSSVKKEMVTLKEYVSRMKEDQDKIYYATGDTTDKIDMLPQVEMFKEKGYEVLYLTDVVDEFTMQSIVEYENKKIVNVASNEANINDEDKEKLEKLNSDNLDMLKTMKEAIDEVSNVKFTNRLKNHPVCLTNEGAISSGMEKTLNALSKEKINAKLVLEINENHPISKKLQDLYKTDKKQLEEYSKVLYAQARLIEGLNIENPTEISSIICNLIAK